MEDSGCGRLSGGVQYYQGIDDHRAGGTQQAAAGAEEEAAGRVYGVVETSEEATVPAPEMGKTRRMQKWVPPTAVTAQV